MVAMEIIFVSVLMVCLNLYSVYHTLQNVTPYRYSIEVGDILAPSKLCSPEVARLRHQDYRLRCGIALFYALSLSMWPTAISQVRVRFRVRLKVWVVVVVMVGVRIRVDAHCSILHLLRFGLFWFGLVWFGLIWFGLVWFRLMWFVLVCFA